MDGADQFIVWQTDGSGNWVSQGGNSTELTAFESAFAQDLDGDGQVGTPADGAVVVATPATRRLDGALKISGGAALRR